MAISQRLINNGLVNWYYSKLEMIEDHGAKRVLVNKSFIYPKSKTKVVNNGYTRVPIKGEAYA